MIQLIHQRIDPVASRTFLTGRLVLNNWTTAAPPLLKLNQRVNWQQFGQTLATVRDQEPKSNAGRKPFDVRLRFQIMILDSCYNLSYHQLEFQIQDRISFLSVLALSLDDTLPEAKTIWLFNPQLTPAGRSKKLFQPRNQFRLRKGKWLLPVW